MSAGNQESNVDRPPPQNCEVSHGFAKEYVKRYIIDTVVTKQSRWRATRNGLPDSVLKSRLQMLRQESLDLVPFLRRQLSLYVVHIGRQMGSRVAVHLEYEMIEECAPVLTLRSR